MCVGAGLPWAASVDRLRSVASSRAMRTASRQRWPVPDAFAWYCERNKIALPDEASVLRSLDVPAGLLVGYGPNGLADKARACGGLKRAWPRSAPCVSTVGAC